MDIVKRINKPDVSPRRTASLPPPTVKPRYRERRFRSPCPYRKKVKQTCFHCFSFFVVCGKKITTITVGKKPKNFYHNSDETRRDLPAYIIVRHSIIFVLRFVFIIIKSIPDTRYRRTRRAYRGHGDVQRTANAVVRHYFHGNGTTTSDHTSCWQPLLRYNKIWSVIAVRRTNFVSAIEFPTDRKLRDEMYHNNC